MPRVAIVGCGDVASIHLEAIEAIEEADLVGVCDTDPERLGRMATRLGVPGFSDHRNLLDDLQPDVVHVTTPHDAHVDVTLAALARGVHVLQEKPVANTLAEAQRLVAAAHPDGPKVGICFQNRYNATSTAIRDLLNGGRLGAIRGAYATVAWARTADYYRDRPWRGSWARSGGGVLINQAIHTLDLVQWFMGGFTSLAGRASTRKFADVMEVEDTAEAYITHPGGTHTSFFATLTLPEHRPVEIEIFAEHATLRLAGDLRVTWADGTEEVVRERRAASAGRTYWGVSHELLIRDFYGSLAAPEPFWISPAEALISLRMLKSVYEQSYPPGVWV